MKKTYNSVIIKVEAAIIIKNTMLPVRDVTVRKIVINFVSPYIELYTYKVGK